MRNALRWARRLIGVAVSAVIAITIRGCQGTTTSDRAEYNEIKSAINSIDWPDDIDNIDSGGYPASDLSSRPEYSRFAVLDPSIRPEAAISDIIANLDANQWSVIAYNCDFPTVAIMENEAKIRVQVRFLESHLSIRYAGELDGPQTATEHPNPICP